MKYFKLLLLWLLPLLTFGSFTNAQFVWAWVHSYPSCWNSLSNLCPLDWFDSFVCDSDWQFWLVVHWLEWNDEWNAQYGYSVDCEAWQSFGVSYLKQLVEDRWHNWSEAVWYFFDGSSTNVWLTLNYQTSQMPVSELTPVVSWLSNSINEFIPYVVYVGLGILWALIGFFAIRRLINRVRRQTFWVFKSKRRK